MNFLLFWFDDILNYENDTNFLDLNVLSQNLCVIRKKQEKNSCKWNLSNKVSYSGKKNGNRTKGI